MTTRAKIAVVAAAIALAALVVAMVTATGGETAGVAATAATLSALAAIVTASVSAATLAQLRRDSRSTTRPQVAAWMRRGGAPGYIDLAIKNFGESIAHDVRVDIVGLPEWAASDAVLRDLVDRYQEPIPTLVPDLELSNTYTASDDTPVPKPPTRVAVHISYTDDEKRPYSDTFDLNANLIRGETWSAQVDRKRR